MTKILQTRFHKIFKAPAGSIQGGFSILETLLSIGLLGICLAAYTKFYINTANLAEDMSEKADYLMLRQFIHSQFSCEASLAASAERVNGRLTKVTCPPGNLGTPVDIMGPDGTIIIAKQDPQGEKAKDGSIKVGQKIGRYRVVGMCDGNGSVPDPSSQIQIPSFRFWASREEDNKIFKAGVGWRAKWHDIFDGNELQCSLPTDPGIPLDSKCTAMFITEPSRTPTGEVHGTFFRSNGVIDYRNGLRMPAVSLLIRSERDLDAPGQGQVTSWKMKWMNKNPLRTIGSYVPNSTSEDNFADPVASPEFTVPANMATATLNQALSNCSRPTEVSGTVPTLNENPGCAFWEQKISFSQMQNPSDWYAAPLDLLIQGADASGKQITECATKLQLVSPLVLVWPKAADSPELEFYPTTAKFDLTATGRRFTSGWINSESAFLVLDRNQNGKIDDGSELFGNASPMPAGTSAENGFAALAAYDDNQDNSIDAKDAVFKDLRLWFDENTDGESQPWELRKLTDHHVEKIGLKYKAVEKQPEEASMLTRFVYESSFYGPGICSGAEGCPIFDIYFTMVFPPDSY